MILFYQNLKRGIQQALEDLAHGPDFTRDEHTQILSMLYDVQEQLDQLHIEQLIDCSECDGLGYRNYVYEHEIIWYECSKCSGSGKINPLVNEQKESQC